MFCSECGTKVNEGAKFCFNCGAKIMETMQDENKTLKVKKEIPLEFVHYVESKFLKLYIEGEKIVPDFFYKKAEFYEVQEEQTNRIVNECEEKINKFEKFMDGVYEECTLFELTEEQEEEIIDFGNSLGFDDEDVENLMGNYDEMHHIEEKQDLYSDCILNYIEDGKSHIKCNGEVEEYQIEVFKVFEKNILKMETFLKEQYEKTNEYELSEEQIDLIYSEGEKLFPEGTIAGIIYRYDNKSGVLKFREEKAKQKALERTTFFELYGKQIAFSEEKTAGINIGKSYRKVFKIINDDFLSFYNKMDCTKDEYWDSLNKKVLALIDQIYKTMAKSLEKKGISNDDISKIDYMKMFQFWIPVFERVDYEYNEICIGTEGAEYYRKLRKENRGRFVGGGFGIEGAFKGIATAGALNMATGAAHSAFNLVGNIKSSWKRLRALHKLFGYSLKEETTTVLQKTIQMSYLIELNVLEKNNVLRGKSFQLFYNNKNATSNIVDVKAFEANPFDESLYENIIMAKGIDEELDEFAKFTGIEIEAIKTEYIRKEREARTADGIVFPTIDDKEDYCEERDIYMPLLEEIIQINAWVEREKFNQKVTKLEQMEIPTVKQWKELRDKVLKWCSNIQKQFSTPNEIYLSKVVKVAAYDACKETIVCQGYKNYNSLFKCFDYIIEFDADENIILFITSDKQKPEEEALIFGTKNIYYLKAGKSIQFDFEQLHSMRFDKEKTTTSKNIIIHMQLTLLNETTIDLVRLFFNSGSSNNYVSKVFADAMQECIDIADAKREKELLKNNNTVVAENSKKDDLLERYNLAVQYEEGDVKTRDIKSAVEIYKELAELGVPLAQWRLGRCYDCGDGVKEDQKMAFELFGKAAKQECAEAQSSLGNYYSSLFNGLFSSPVQRNDKCAVVWYLKSAMNGYFEAQMNLANHYYSGLGVKEDLSQAVYWWTKAANQEVASAQFLLGRSYEYGEGVVQSEQEALYWYDKAAKQGFKEAIESAKKLRQKHDCYSTTKNDDLQKKYDLAVSYEEGNLGKRDIKKAIEIYRELAELNLPEAQWRLGRCYGSGDGVEKDSQKAFELFSKAANQECLEAINVLGRYYSSLLDYSYPPEKDDQYATELFLKAAKKGNAIAQNNLAMHYLKGVGVEKDLSQAIYWFTESAKQGVASAQYNLGFCYQYGDGVKRSKEKALYWYNEAAKQGDKQAIDRAKKLKGGCYITTAVCRSFGKADNCYELQTFRMFRDEWLKYQNDGEDLIQEYYRTAPDIVDKIESKIEASSIFENIWNDYLKHCLHYIENEEFEKCKELYIKMVEDMKDKYLTH